MFHVKHPAWQTLANLANRPNARTFIGAIRVYIPTVGILIRSTPIGKTRTRQIAHRLASACLRFTRPWRSSTRDIHDITERQRTKRPGACRPRSATRQPLHHQPHQPRQPFGLPCPPRPRRTAPSSATKIADPVGPTTPAPSPHHPRLPRSHPAPHAVHAPSHLPSHTSRSHFPLRNPSRHPRPPQPEPATHPRSCCGNSVVIRALSHSRS